MKITLIGTGPGNRNLLTTEAENIIKKADVLIGAERMTALWGEGKRVYTLYKAEEIVSKLKDTGIGSSVAVMLSGDPGFFSSAKRLFKLLDSDEAFKGADIDVIPGISSVQYFLENLHMSWENTKFVSLHGRQANIIGYVKRYPKVFALTGNGSEIKEIAERLHYYNMDNVKIIIGEKLSYPDENILLTDPVKLITEEREVDKLSVALFLNEDAEDESLHSLNDADLIRGEVPMTKGEVRTISISKLKLSPDSVLYDIGAGTGSISIEASLRLLDGEVYAVEKKSDAVDLIQKNKRKFAADNIRIINDTAPRGLEKLPPPTHVFIGGSSGNMKEIIDKSIEKNPDVRIVINLISLDSLSELLSLMNERNWRSDISLINISKLREVSGNKLMAANNPVYVIAIGPEDRKEIEE